MILKKNSKFYFGSNVDYKVGIIYLNSRRKNLFFTLTDLIGQVLICKSAASLNIERKKLHSPQVADILITSICNIAKLHRLNSIKIYLKFRNKYILASILNVLQAYALNVYMIEDFIPVPHNGSKRKLIRRL